MYRNMSRYFPTSSYKKSTIDGMRFHQSWYQKTMVMKILIMASQKIRFNVQQITSRFLGSNQTACQAARGQRLHLHKRSLPWTSKEATANQRSNINKNNAPIYTWICIWMYVLPYICMCVCERMADGWTNGCMHTSTYTSMRVFMYACT